jgi:hypothetical protein
MTEGSLYISAGGITVNSGVTAGSFTSSTSGFWTSGGKVIDETGWARFTYLQIGGAYTVIDASRNAAFVNVDASGVYKVDGTQVVSNQQTAIANPTVAPPSGSGTAVASAFAGDAYNCVNELYSKLNSVLAALRAHGLIAT